MNKIREIVKEIYQYGFNIGYMTAKPVMYPLTSVDEILSENEQDILEAVREMVPKEIVKHECYGEDCDCSMRYEKGFNECRRQILERLK